MTLTQHTALSSGIAALLWVVTRSIPLATASILTGVLIDLDHWIDYFREHGWPRRGIQHFFDAAYNREYNHGYFILHGWEWLFIGIVVSWATAWNPWVTGAWLGWTHHLVADQIYNRPSRWGYSLAYRWANRFDFKAMYPEENPPS